MNTERIRELAKQAEEEVKAEYEDESRRNRRLYNEIFLPKFAELIVQECCQKLENKCGVADAAMDIREMEARTKEKK